METDISGSTKGDESRLGVWMLLWGVFVIFLGSLGIRFAWNPFASTIEKLELTSYDHRVRIQGGVPFHPEKVAIVGIDNNTFGYLESDPRTKKDAKWPFPNTFHSEVSEKLLSWGARSVAFDLLSFCSPSRPKYQDEDISFAEVANRTGRILVSARFAAESRSSWEKGFRGTNTTSEKWTVPAKPFKGIPVGYINSPVDIDGSIRMYQPYYWRLGIFPINPLAVEALRIASFPNLLLTLAPEKCCAAPSLEYFPYANPNVIGANVIPYGEILLASDTSSSATARLSEMKKMVSDRVVFVGPLFTESHDFFQSPFSGQEKTSILPGVFLHAMIANSLLNGYRVRRVSKEYEKALGVLFIFIGLGASWLFAPAYGFLLAFFGAVLYCLYANHVFSSQLYWVPVVSPLLAALAATVPNLALRLLVSERKRFELEKKQAVLKNLFAKYVSEEVLGHILANPELLRLDGERREVTVFFSDLKGFTTISETMPPEKLSEIMNEYLTPMTEIIMDHKGYLDKYIGDAIMAVFGAPQSDPRNVYHACLAALRQRDRLKTLADKVEKESGVRISARMGINTGVVCAGNMGSEDRFQYTVMGDIVNQASRFEGANKIFGSTIMIGEETYNTIREEFIARKLAHLTVKGKTKAVVVYELMEAIDPASKNAFSTIRDLCNQFEAALNEFLKADISKAEKLFSALSSSFPEDGPTRFYLEECQNMLAHGVPEHFHGGIKPDTK